MNVSRPSTSSCRGLVGDLSCRYRPPPRCVCSDQRKDTCPLQFLAASGPTLPPSTRPRTGKICDLEAANQPSGTRTRRCSRTAASLQRRPFRCRAWVVGEGFWLVVLVCGHGYEPPSGSLRRVCFCEFAPSKLACETSGSDFVQDHQSLSVLRNPHCRDARHVDSTQGLEAPDKPHNSSGESQGLDIQGRHRK